MESAAFGLAVVCLIGQGYLWYRFYAICIRDVTRPERDVGFSVFKPAKASKRPRVRDELAAWRVEQEERYEWESKLREKENRE